MGATVVYQKVLRPYLLKEQNQVDSAIDKLKQSATKAASDLASELKKD